MQRQKVPVEQIVGEKFWNDENILWVVNTFSLNGKKKV
jgi:hypothetical protein